MRGFWKQIRYRIEWILLKFLAWIVPVLPRGFLFFVADRLADLAWIFDRRSRETAMENLRAAFGNDPDWNDERIRHTARDSFRYFGRAMMDLFWSPRLTKEQAKKLIRYEVMGDKFEDMAALERSVPGGAIWLTPHYGNFEWIAYGMGLRGLSFCIIAQDFKNERLTGIFSQVRSGSGHDVISQDGAMLKLMRHLKRGGHSAFLPDLTVKPSKAATVIDCFGMKTCVTLLHAILVQRLKLPIIAGLALPQRDGTYCMKVFPPLALEEGSSLQSIAQQCWDPLEAEIRKNPAPWLWMYKHWRYRPRGPVGDGYPAYANHSKAFDKLMREQTEAEQN